MLTISGVHMLPAIDTYAVDVTSVRTCQITDQINTSFPVTSLNLCVVVCMPYKASSLCCRPTLTLLWNELYLVLQNVMNWQSVCIVR